VDAERFEMIGELGRGGTGRVYRVLDRTTGQELALKSLRSPSPRDLYRFKREFRAVAELRHPNLVTLHELFEADGEWMFTMELIDGAPLHTGVRPRLTDPIDADRVADAIAQLTDALIALHATGTIHRDLKPSNVLREPGGRVIVLDFGLASDLALPDRTHDRMAVGTPAYMSPEQARDEPLTTASDWYGVGVILYEILTGRRPFEGASSAVLALKQQRDPMPPGSLADGVPIVLETLCLQLLARVPSQRPDGVAVLAALGREPSAATRAIMAQAAPRPLRGRDDELARLRQALADARDHPVGVLVRGPTGSGKTTLLDAIVAETRAAGVALVLHARMTQREALPFRALDQLVDQLTTYLLGLPAGEIAALVPPDVALLTSVFPAVKRLAAIQGPPFAGPPLSVDELRHRAAGAAIQLLRAVAQRTPLLIAIDDGQFSTAAGSSVINDHVQGVDGPRTCFVITHDSEADTVVLRNLLTWKGDLRVIDL